MLNENDRREDRLYIPLIRQCPRRNRRASRIYNPDTDHEYTHVRYINVAMSTHAPMTDEEVQEHIIGIFMVLQFFYHKVVKKFGRQAKTVVSKELRQMHDIATVMPVDSKLLTKQQRAEALASYIFLTEKRDRHIKDHQFINVRPQRSYIKKKTLPLQQCGGEYFYNINN